MKKQQSVWFWPIFLLILSGNVLAQTTTSFGPYAHTVGNQTYQATGTFTNQTWGEVTLVLSLKNTGTSAIDVSGGSEVWFTGSTQPTVVSYPSLGGLSYPESGVITALPRGNAKLIQTNITFPTESWANRMLAPGQTFSINYNLGSGITAGEFSTLAQSVRLYANGWPRPNLYVPLTINLSGTGNQPGTVNILNKTTSTTSTERITSGTVVNVFEGDELAIWGSNFTVGNTLYTSSYTAQNPLLVRAGQMSAVTLPFSASVIPSGAITVSVGGLPTGASAKLTLTGATYPVSKEVSLVNGTNTLPAMPYDTYTVSVNRYANETANIIAVPTYPANYAWQGGSTPPLSVSFSAATIKPFGVDGWPKYLAMGSITLGDETNDLPLSKAPLNAIFKYSGSGMGDTSFLLDDSSPGFPTTRTITQARRLEERYASLYPGVAPPTVMPVMVHYTAQASGGGIGEPDVYNDAHLQIHYRNLIRETKKLLSYRDAAHPFPGTFVLSPDLLGAQQQSNTPNSFSDYEIFNHFIPVNEQIRSAFEAEGLSTASLPVFTQNWPGYYQSMNYVIKTIGQGAIKYGWQINVWATGTSLWMYDQTNQAGPRQAQTQAQAITAFVNGKMGAFSGPWKPDFVVMDRYEADCFSVRGQNYAYNTRAWDRFVEFSGAIGKNLSLPVMLWQIPGGHLVTNNETIQNYDINGHSSASATYFLGDANVGVGTANVRPAVLSLPLRPINTVYNTTATTIGEWLNQTPNYDYGKSQLQKLADNNIFSILWGGGETIAVAPIGTNGNDDGWLAAKLLTYSQNERVYPLGTTPPTPVTVVECTAAPAVALGSPVVSGTAPASITLTATASVSCGAVTKVEFYNGGNLLGSSTASPYRIVWSNVGAGAYTLTAKAYANSAITTSAPVPVSVSAGTNVTLTQTSVCAGIAAWNTTQTYAAAGQKVTYGGRLYESMYWTQGNAPASPYVPGAPWKDMGACGTGQGRIGAIEPAANQPIKAYPNPTDGRLTVEFYVNETDTAIRFDIVDLTGKRVFRVQDTFAKGHQKKTLHLTGLIPQLYILQLTTGLGHKIGMQSFLFGH